MRKFCFLNGAAKLLLLSGEKRAHLDIVVTCDIKSLDLF